LRHEDVFLVTPRLRLRRARSDDLDAFHEILSDPEAMRWWSSEPHGSLDRTREWLDRMIASPAEESEDFVVELNGRAIGKAGFDRPPEIGYILSRGVWRRGYASEALAAAIAGFTPVLELANDTAPRDDVHPRPRCKLQGFDFFVALQRRNSAHLRRAWPATFLAVSSGPEPAGRRACRPAAAGGAGVQRVKAGSSAFRRRRTSASSRSSAAAASVSTAVCRAAHGSAPARAASTPSTSVGRTSSAA
jgi:hypothetical protein